MNRDEEFWVWVGLIYFIGIVVVGCLMMDAAGM
jgi:hypothetical protein